MKKIKITESITSRDESLTKFLRSTSKYPLLSMEEEVFLSQKAKQGDTKARDKIVLSNARFLVSIAKKYQYTGLPLMDLISEGQFGLIDAVNRFDETKGFKLISFAVWHIRQHIHKFIYAQQKMIRLPANQLIIGSKVNRLTQQLEQILERSPTQNELIESSDLTIAQIKDSVTNPSSVLSIDKITNPDSGGRLMDVLENKNTPKADYNLELESNQINLDRLFKILPVRQMKIVQHFFGTNGFSHLTLEEIAETVGLSKERTRQIKDDGMKRLSAAVRITGVLRS
ncbi:MAG: RNA polymerase sigma factor RpoD/SigA [Pedobacter sp.]|nr:RNA polymerase sigma factor RpoD/SigA [Pedobacter sp.]